MKEKKLKVLFFVDRLLWGGIQSLIYDILKHNDGKRMLIDVLHLDDGIEYPLANTLREMGTTVYQLKNTYISTPLDLPNYFKQVDAFFAIHHDYDVVHMHSSSKNYYMLKAAKKYGIPIRVAHSHNTGFQTHNPLSIILGDLMKRPMKKYATHCYGCSQMACEWLFGKGCVERGKAKVIPNGIYSTPFIYKEEIRKEVRQELQLEDKFVIGNVGRFERQKNHDFLIDIFSEIVKLQKNACLVLVGTGSLQNILEQKVETLKLSDKVKFLGFRKDRYRIMQAMDSFVFPSLFEGFGLGVIEAEAAGLPVFSSENVPNDVKFTSHTHFLSLQQPAKEWAKAIVEKGQIERKDMTEKIKKAGFDIQNLINNLYNTYIGK